MCVCVSSSSLPLITTKQLLPAWKPQVLKVKLGVTTIIKDSRLTFPNIIVVCSWHRRFMERIEDTIGMRYPYWDWSSNSAIPQACADKTYVNADGDTVPNPLFAGIKNDGSKTSRSQSPSLSSKQVRDKETSAMAATDFGSLNDLLEDL